MSFISLMLSACEMTATGERPFQDPCESCVVWPNVRLVVAVQSYFAGKPWKRSFLIRPERFRRISAESSGNIMRRLPFSARTNWRAWRRRGWRPISREALANAKNVRTRSVMHSVAAARDTPESSYANSSRIGTLPRRLCRRVSSRLAMKERRMPPLSF